MPDPIEQDQDDIVGRLQADSELALVAILEQRRGVAESDVQSAVSIGNKRAGGKRGLVLIVLMPELTPSEADAPGPEYTLRYGVQAIEHPILNRGTHGSGISAEAAMRRVRQLLHRFEREGRTLSFGGMEPVPVAEGMISYIANFTARDMDEPSNRVGLPLIDPEEGEAPLEVTITCGTPTAAIYTTTDGSYPSSANPAAVLYSGPFTVASACKLRAAAELAGLQQSNVAEAIFS